MSVEKFSLKLGKNRICVFVKMTGEAISMFPLTPVTAMIVLIVIPTNHEHFSAALEQSKQVGKSIKITKSLDLKTLITKKTFLA